MTDFTDPLESSLRDLSLMQVLDEITGATEANRTGLRYSVFLARLEAKRFVVPLAGVQGAGKSTLLNAIAFACPVLPIDADETTAVPVEAVWAENPSGEAQIRFADGRVKRVEASESGLSPFVHQEHNPRNEKGVDRIVVESAAPLLRDGLVLVDLPGMGSLNRENGETTQRYLGEAIGVAFLLRTVPPLTKWESLFVAATWKRFPTSLFVQNRWSDESDQDVADGRSHNEAALARIAKEYRIAGEPPKVHVVDAYAAHHAKLCDDERQLASSKLPGLCEALSELANGWPRAVRDAIRSSVAGDCRGALESLDAQLADQHRSRSELEAEQAREDALFREYVAGIERRADETKGSLGELEREVGSWLAKWESDTKRDLRNQMRTKLRAGIVDGPRLSRALSDEQDVKLTEALEHVQEQVIAAGEVVRQKFDGAPGWKGERPGTRETVDRPEARKYEAILPTLLSGGAGLAAGWAGAKAGALIGAKIGWLGGPKGLVIGTIVGGALGGLIGTFSGQQTKKFVVAQRAERAEPEVFNAIDVFAQGTHLQFRHQVSDAVASLGGIVDVWVAAQRLRYEQDRDRRGAAASATADERQVRIDVLRAQRNTVEAALGRLMSSTGVS